MPIEYDGIVPWGRNYDEYCRMFALTPADLKKRILGCGDGPAGFNAVCNARGGRVISVDPIYAFSKEQIARRIDEMYVDVLDQTRNNREKFRWDTIPSVERLGEIRMAAMTEFLATYEKGKAAGRYMEGSLPEIDFPDNRFDLVLSSHFLLLYSANLSLEFHIASITEMLRVAAEVRIFPIVDLNAVRSPYVEEIRSHFSSFLVQIRKVDYEFQIGGNEMMVIRKKSEQ